MMSPLTSPRPDEDRLAVWLFDPKSKASAEDVAGERLVEERPEPRSSVFKGFLIGGLVSLGLWAILLYAGRLILG